MKPEQRKEIDELAGTSGVYDSQICDRLGIDDAKLEELAAEIEVERCTQCGWWCESAEMEVVDSEATCEDCRN